MIMTASRRTKDTSRDSTEYSAGTCLFWRRARKAHVCVCVLRACVGACECASAHVEMCAPLSLTRHATRVNSNYNSATRRDETRVVDVGDLLSETRGINFLQSPLRPGDDESKRDLNIFLCVRVCGHFYGNDMFTVISGEKHTMRRDTFPEEKCLIQLKLYTVT